ncbi:phytanoyl-CoA dioxygenase family protein [Paremcibacter congregatus]|uniref:phytanoyl-CoA dioxygenase family protein n=1 Tax=Paremcibacter congregatus TaxID=2043170 RepID=UPI003A8E8CC7
MTRRNDIESHTASLKKHGFVVIPNLIRGPELASFSRDICDAFKNTPYSEGSFGGLKTKRMGRIFSKSKQARDLAVHPLVLGVIKNILGDYCDRIQINLTQAIQIAPGELEQYLHRDDELFPFPKSTAEFMVNAMWAIDDFTEMNGATVIWPGSHRQGLAQSNPAEETIQATMKRGSVLIWLGSLQHGGGANNSLFPRTGVAISYCLGWLRQAENQYLAYPPHIAKEFNAELQDLIGYKVHRPNLGWYEGQEPSILFEETPEALAAQDLFPPEFEELTQEFAEGGTS